MRRRFASALAGALLLLPPSQALAQQAHCRTIRALTNADGREFADLRFNLGSAAVTLRAGSRAPDLEGAAECEMRTEGDHRDIECRWRFYDQTAATDFYDNLLARMRTCLAEPMPDAEINTRTEGWLVTRRHIAMLMAEYSQTDLELSLVDATSRGEPDAAPASRYFVQIAVAFEQGD